MKNAIFLIFVFLFLNGCDKKAKTTRIGNREMENTFMKDDEVEIVEEEITKDKIVSFTYFEPYLNKNINEILRVVGRPGDRFKIWRGNIYINDQLHELPKTVKLGYYLKVKEGTTERNFGESGSTADRRVAVFCIYGPWGRERV